MSAEKDIQKDLRSLEKQINKREKELNLVNRQIYHMIDKFLAKNDLGLTLDDALKTFGRWDDKEKKLAEKRIEITQDLAHMGAEKLQLQEQLAKLTDSKSFKPKSSTQAKILGAFRAVGKFNPFMLKPKENKKPRPTVVKPTEEKVAQPNKVEIAPDDTIKPRFKK